MPKAQATQIAEDVFHELYIQASSSVADKFYPKGKSKRRGEYLRDQGVLYYNLLEKLKDMGYIRTD